MELHSEIRRLQGIIGAMCFLTIGKYKGRSFAYVKNVDFGYCEWVMGLHNPKNQLGLFKDWLLSTATIIRPRSLEEFFTPCRTPLRYEAELRGLF